MATIHKQKDVIPQRITKGLMKTYSNPPRVSGLVSQLKARSSSIYVMAVGLEVEEIKNKQE